LKINRVIETASQFPPIVSSNLYHSDFQHYWRKLFFHKYQADFFDLLVVLLRAEGGVEDESEVKAV
jgi:hypothetical protein